MKNKTLTKMDIAKVVYSKIGYSRKFSEELVDDFFQIVKDHLLKGQGIKFHGFGKFTLKDKKTRKGRNPQTGKSIMISARRVLLFHASSIFKKKF